MITMNESARSETRLKLTMVRRRKRVQAESSRCCHTTLHSRGDACVHGSTAASLSAARDALAGVGRLDHLEGVKLAVLWALEAQWIRLEPCKGSVVGKAACTGLKSDTQERVARMAERLQNTAQGSTPTHLLAVEDHEGAHDIWAPLTPVRPIDALELSFDLGQGALSENVLAAIFKRGSGGEALCPRPRLANALKQPRKSLKKGGDDRVSTWQRTSHAPRAHLVPEDEISVRCRKGHFGDPRPQIRRVAATRSDAY